MPSARANSRGCCRADEKYSDLGVARRRRLVENAASIDPPNSHPPVFSYQSPRFTMKTQPPTKRLARLYCVGAPKSGTHSIAELFAPPVRSLHEPEAERTIDFILAKEAGQFTPEQVRAHLQARDQRLRLDVDSAHLNVFLVPELVAMFPEARFVLTVREPRGWLDSFINQQLGRPGGPRWQKMRDLRFQPERFPHRAGEGVLQQRGLYSLDGYLAYWAWHNQLVLDTVPPERLLVVETHDIGDRAVEIAAFGGISPTHLRPERAHAYPAAAKFEMLASIPPDRLTEAVLSHCGPLMQRLFPVPLD